MCLERYTHINKAGEKPFKGNKIALAVQGTTLLEARKVVLAGLTHDGLSSCGASLALRSCPHVFAETKVLHFNTSLLIIVASTKNFTKYGIYDSFILNT